MPFLYVIDGGIYFCTICYTTFCVISIVPLKKLKPSTINANEWRGKVDNLILKIVSLFLFCWFEKNDDAYCKKKWNTIIIKKSKNIYVVWFNYYKLAKIRLVNFFSMPLFRFYLISFNVFGDNWLLFTMWLYFSLHNFKCIYRLFVVFLLVSLFAFVLTPFR